MTAKEVLDKLQAFIAAQLRTTSFAADEAYVLYDKIAELREELKAESKNVTP